MKTRLFQSLKLTLLLVSSSVLAGSLYTIDHTYGRGETAQQTTIPTSLAKAVKPLLLLPESLFEGQLQVSGARVNAQQNIVVEPVLEVDLCLDLPGWERPSEQIQRKQLEQMERYNGLLQDERLTSLAKDWWTHEAFSFTTYGLSARTDPHYLSGIWTALDHIWDCYDAEQPQQINNGDLAELWLINHHLVDIQWQDSHYVITVESSASGLQLLQFQRQESYDSLPIVMMTATGQEILVMSGDW